MKLRNFSGMMSIVMALQHPDISRLKGTWELLPKATLKVKEDMEELGSPLNNFRNLRHMIYSSPPPFIPCLRTFSLAACRTPVWRT